MCILPGSQKCQTPSRPNRHIRGVVEKELHLIPAVELNCAQVAPENAVVPSSYPWVSDKKYCRNIVCQNCSLQTRKYNGKHLLRKQSVSEKLDTFFNICRECAQTGKHLGKQCFLDCGDRVTVIHGSCLKTS